MVSEAVVVLVCGKMVVVLESTGSVLVVELVKAPVSEVSVVVDEVEVVDHEVVVVAAVGELRVDAESMDVSVVAELAPASVTAPTGLKKQPVMNHEMSTATLHR